MTDNEIKQALPFLAKYCKDEYNDIRVDEVLLGAFDIINRQQAEKEALIAGQETMSKYIEEQQAEIEKLTEETMNMAITIETCKAEAIKEFAERLKEKKNAVCAGHGLTTYAVDEYDIDCILKEMVGEE